MKEEKLPGGFSYSIPTTIVEARDLAEISRMKDPYHNIIQPSLLNKHDIVKYVSKTGMIFPFEPDRLKSASYEVPLGNEYVKWLRKDGEPVKVHKKDLSSKDRIPIGKNSITFVDVDANFFLPYYIALRFNLSITHVHRGILLGTGPLIDPGFCGKIMIPIHNLTNNNYWLTPGETLIAVEFTKLTQDEILLNTDSHDINPWYRKNIKDDKLTFSDYFDMALPHGINSVESSIGKYINEATKSLEDIKSKSESTLKTMRNISYGTFVALVIGISAAYIQIQGVVSSVNKYVSDTEQQHSSKINELSKRIDGLYFKINKEKKGDEINNVQTYFESDYIEEIKRENQQ